MVEEEENKKDNDEQLDYPLMENLLHKYIYNIHVVADYNCLREAIYQHAENLDKILYYKKKMEEVGCTHYNQEIN